jgi:PAS domain S-box-containing protein
LGTLSYTNYQKDKWEKDTKGILLEILMSKKTRLEKALYSRIHYTRSVAAYVSLKPELSNMEFYNLAEELIMGDSVICTMALSKDCIIDAVYPIIGHEAAIGLNLLAHPERNEIVQKTISSHKTFIAGPVKLLEGGLAFISYTPIFYKTSDKNGEFWGLTDIVIYQDKLIDQVGLRQKESGFLFAIRGYNGLGDEGDVWWGDPQIFEQNPVSLNIDLPYGNWVLAAVPETGWNSYLNQDRVMLILLLCASFIISVLVWLVVASIVKRRRNAQELNAIFQSLDSLIIEFDQKGKYIKIPPCNSALLVKPKEELLGKTVYDIFSEKEAQVFHELIIKCLNTKELVEYEYPVLINGKSFWFLARVSWKSEQSVIFHAINITEQKIAREKIIDSERRLKELNATKDKFFSIIAHDLKSPFNVILGFSDLLKSDYNELNDEQRIKSIQAIDSATKSAYELLENLLLWANTQSGKIKINKEKINLRSIINEAIAPYLPGAEKKSIKYEIDVPGQLMVFADRFTIRTVIANLFNNAIKFTPAMGNIKVKATNKNGFIEIVVSDNGVGIPAEVIPKLFLIDESISTQGTENEQGTGLGLLLCKEFVAKHKGEIWVKSELREKPEALGSNWQSLAGGTSFYIKLPSEANEGLGK